MVLGELDLAAAASAPEASDSDSPFVVSPVAVFNADGTWRVTWTPEPTLKIVAFEPIVTEKRTSGFLPGDADAELSPLERMRLAQLGSSAPSVVAGSVTLSPMGVPFPPPP